jgi:hypothetical protein
MQETAETGIWLITHRCHGLESSLQRRPWTKVQLYFPFTSSNWCPSFEPCFDSNFSVNEASESSITITLHREYISSFHTTHFEFSWTQISWISSQHRRPRGRPQDSRRVSKGFPTDNEDMFGSEMLKWEDLGKGWTWQCEIRGWIINRGHRC